jgi:hypothetical protein
VDRLQLELAPAGRPKKTAKLSTLSAGAADSIGNNADDVLTPRAVESPVVAVLKARGLYKTPLGSGKHNITCPWAHEHSDALDTGAAYFEPEELYPVGAFAAGTPIATGTTLRRCSNSSVCAADRPAGPSRRLLWTSEPKPALLNDFQYQKSTNQSFIWCRGRWSLFAVCVRP